MASYITSFPYQREYTTDVELYEMFEKLKKYDYKKRVTHRKYYIKNLDLRPHELTYLGKFCLLVVIDEDYFSWRRISEVFQDECRMKCRLYSRDQSPEEYFYSHIKEINQRALEDYGAITPQNIREVIYSLKLECTSHNPAHIVALIQRFGARSVLDFCAGWGDRMIGAMAADVEFFCGVDPNPCLHPNYAKMIKFFGKSPKNFVMIKDTIEEAKLPHRKFDMVFTSPPYFDLEIYSDDPRQSTAHKTEKAWFDKFLKVAIAKSWNYLRNGGFFCLNINQKNKSEHYIRWMLDYMKAVNSADYMGIISYANEDLRNPQPIFIWKKLDAFVKSKKHYIKDFDIPMQGWQHVDISIYDKETDEHRNMFRYLKGEGIDKTLAKTFFIYPTRAIRDKELLLAFLRKMNKRIHLLIDPQNKDDVAFYKSVGFSFRRSAHYCDGNNHLYLWNP